MVAEQTGYPVDLLDPELDLEADLGDRHGQAGGVVRDDPERYGIERDDNLKLRDYPTLNAVAGFVLERAAAPTPEPAGARQAPAVGAAPAAAEASAAGEATDGDVLAAILEVVAEQTGYPPISWTWIWIWRPDSGLTR